MHRPRSGILGAALVAAALGLSSCSHAAPPASPPTPLTSAAPEAAGPAPTAALPAAETLADVLYRLADPAVPGAEKLNLLEAAKPTDAETLDKFVTALRDSGYLPLDFTASDVAWSDQDPGYAAVNVDVATANPDNRGFFFPMEFIRHGDGWQLSRKTAEMLLTFGDSRAGAPPAGQPGASSISPP